MAHRVVIVGGGAAGMQTALELKSRGIEPVIVERGKDVHLRRLDIAAIHRNQGGQQRVSRLVPQSVLSRTRSEGKGNVDV